MERKEYNGWTNYETWAVNLWLTNDERTYGTIIDLIKTFSKDYDAAEAIKEYMDECNPLNETPTVFTDLLNAALSEVNWIEIARSFRETVEEQETYERAR